MGFKRSAVRVRPPRLFRPFPSPEGALSRTHPENQPQPRAPRPRSRALAAFPARPTARPSHPPLSLSVPCLCLKVTVSSFPPSRLKIVGYLQHRAFLHRPSPALRRPSRRPLLRRQQALPPRQQPLLLLPERRHPQPPVYPFRQHRVRLVQGSQRVLAWAARKLQQAGRVRRPPFFDPPVELLLNDLLDRQA